jgi:site-specific DNA-methyltransferase (adenine-specific)
MELYNEDCLAILKTLTNKSVDLVLLDLPYGQTNCKWDIKIDLDELWFQLKRIGKPNTAYIFFTTTKFGYELIKSNEKWFRYDLVWSKNGSAGFLNSKKMPMRCHEMVYIFYDKLPTYNLTHFHTLTNKGNKTDKTVTDLYGKTEFKISGSKWEPRLPSSILHFPINQDRRSKKQHPTQKPIDLLVWFINYYSKSGDTILDPTMGVGSTGLACKAVGDRHFIGIELDPNYFAIATDALTTTFSI